MQSQALTGKGNDIPLAGELRSIYGGNSVCPYFLPM